LKRSALGRWLVAVAALAAITASLWQLMAARAGVIEQTLYFDGIPASVFQAEGAPPAPAVVIAHGFAGSRQLMRSFALTLAQAGYLAVTFDFPGHGRNPAPLTGSITEASGATQRLIDATRAVMDGVRRLPGSDGGLALLGHSMATDVLVRTAARAPQVEALVAVSMFSREVTPASPPNLLVIVGEWESQRLKQQGLDAAAMVSAGEAIRPGETYGRFAQGTARKTVIAPNVEHIGVLFSGAAVSAARDWLDRVFERGAGAGAGAAAPRGGWIALLLAGIVALGWPLAHLLPRLAEPPQGAGLGWRALALPVAVPAAGAPLVLWALPTDFLPVLVGDDLAVFFLVYGLLSAAALGGLRRGGRPRLPAPRRLLAAAAAIAVYGLAVFGGAIHATAANFMPVPGRLPLIAAMAAGTLVWALADEWLTRGAGAARGAYPATKIVFLLSLGGAVALQPRELFFLLIVLPAMVLFFLVLGLFSRWSLRRTGHPWAAGLANAVILAWAIGVTFPMLGH